MRELSEILHHECDPPEKLDKELKFSAKLRALIEKEDDKVILLADCTFEQLEERGHLKQKF